MIFFNLQHEKEFTYIIGAVKGGPGEKRLASQFIARFFKYFPGLAPQAINAMFDLCEDDDVNVSLFVRAPEKSDYWMMILCA